MDHGLDTPAFAALFRALREKGYGRLQFVPQRVHGAWFMKQHPGLVAEREESLKERLGRGEPIVLEHCADQDFFKQAMAIGPDLDQLGHLFLANALVPQDQFQRLLEPDTRRAAAPLMEQQEGGVRCKYRVIPMFDLLLVADPLDLAQKDAVFFNRDSMLLASWLRSNGGMQGPVVDVGAGTGLLGFVAREAGGGPVTCLDVNPKAVAYARANAALNNVDGVAFACSSFESLAMPEHGALVSNPPYMFFPGDQGRLCEDGGGLLGMEKAVAIACKGLKHHCSVCMILVTPVTDQGPVFDQAMEPHGEIRSKELLETVPVAASQDQSPYFQALGDHGVRELQLCIYAIGEKPAEKES